MSTRTLRPTFALLLGGIAVVVCYYFVDRPVAWFVYNHRLYSDEFLEWPPFVWEWLTYFLILGMVVVVVWRLRRPGSAIQTLLLAIGINLIATAGIKAVMKGALGRTWPIAWIQYKAGIRADDVYGFYLFQFDRAYHSFPSGHAASTFAVLSILWLSRPRWRWLYAVVGGLMCVALIGLNYHFVGDVIAGVMLGSVTGVYATRIFRLRPVEMEQERVV